MDEIGCHMFGFQPNSSSLGMNLVSGLGLKIFGLTNNSGGKRNSTF